MPRSYTLSFLKKSGGRCELRKKKKLQTHFSFNHHLNTSGFDRQTYRRELYTPEYGGNVGQKYIFGEVLQMKFTSMWKPRVDTLNKQAHPRRDARYSIG